MGVLSILPESFMLVELWVTRLFLLLGILTIGPWVGLLVYDFLLYCYRATAYEIPFIGGRAKGKVRPRAPSLTERPSGHRRGFSLGRRKGRAESMGGLKSDLPDTRFRHITEESDWDSSTA